MDYQSIYTGPQIDERLTKAGTAYQLPEGGIPKSDLSEGVKDSLDSADSAYQKPVDGIPASDLAQGVIPDVSQFITKSVDDLIHYYLKSDTYTKSEVQALIGAINQFHYEIYASLSDVTNPANNVLYLIGPTGSGSDKYEEYVWPDTQTGFVKIGDTSIDLSGYVTMDAMNTALANYTTTTDLNLLLAHKEDSINKISTWGQTPSETKYPSEKLTYDSIGKRGVISQTQTWTLATDGGYDYTMSNQVYGLIPQANIDLFMSAGATFNETTGYFELNGLTDVSYEEMQKIMLYPDFLKFQANRSFEFYWDSNRRMAPRTLLPFPDTFNHTTFAQANFTWFMFICPTEVVKFNTSCSNISNFFRQCYYLKDLGKINISAISAAGNVADAFFSANSLESVQLKGLKVNISLANSPRLSLAAVVYMVENAGNTSAITITLHATAYARCQADTTEYTYGGQTYTGIIALAAAKNITIQSA